MKRYVRSSEYTDSSSNKILKESLDNYIKDIAYEMYEDKGEPGDQNDFVQAIVKDDNIQRYQTLLVSAIQDAIDVAFDRVKNGGRV